MWGAFSVTVVIVVIAPLQPTLCHYFIRLLKEKGLLLRCYTQVGGTVGVLGGGGRLPATWRLSGKSSGPATLSCDRPVVTWQGTPLL